MISYPAIFHKEESHFWVEFPDFECCVTQGDTFEEAKLMAVDALTNVLESMDSRKLKIPSASVLEGKDVYYIEPQINVAFAISLKKERENLGLSQKEVADRIGIKWAAYQRIENPRKTNPTLSTIAKLKTVFSAKAFFTF